MTTPGRILSLGLALAGLLAARAEVNFWYGTENDAFAAYVRSLMQGQSVADVSGVEAERRALCRSLAEALKGSKGYGVVVPSTEKTGQLGRYGVPTTTEPGGMVALADLGRFAEEGGRCDAASKRELVEKLSALAGGRFELTAMNDQAVTTLARVSADGKGAVVAAFNPGPDLFHNFRLLLRRRPEAVEVLQNDGIWLERGFDFDPKTGILLLPSQASTGDVFVFRVTFGVPVVRPAFTGRDSDWIESAVQKACADGSRTATIPRKADGTPWYVTRAILLPDDFTLVLDDCTVQLAPGTRDNLIRNAGAVGLRQVTPNRNITVRGKGKAVLCGGVDNHYAPNRSGDSNGWPTIGVLFARVTGFAVENVTLRETQSWGMSFEYCSDGHIADICLEDTNLLYNQDGIDLRVGCHDIVIERITGVCGDDAVALTGCGDGEHSAMLAVQKGWANKGSGSVPMEISREPHVPTAAEAIHDVTVRDVRARSAGGHGVIRLLPNDGVEMYNIAVSNVVDTTQPHQRRAFGTVRIGDVHYTVVRPAAVGDLHHITVENVEAKARVGISFKCPLSDSTIRNVRVPEGTRKYDLQSSLVNVTLE